MASEVWDAVAATLIATGIVTDVGYFVVGPRAAAVCLTVGLIFAIVLRISRHKKAGSASVPSAPTINNSATLSASPHIEVHIGDAERKPQELQAPDQRADTQEIPSIASLKPKEVLLHEDEKGVWFEASQQLDRARKALVIPFKNLPKAPRERTPRASSVTASLVFRNIDNSDELHINHGVWLGHYEYFATFNSGETQYLLLALKDAPFVTPENPNAHNPFSGGFFRSGTAIQHPQMVTLWTEGTVEIILVGWRDVTLFQGMFDYKLSTKEMVLAPKRPARGKVHFVPDAHNHGWAGNDGRMDLRVGGTLTYDGVGTLIIANAFFKGTQPMSNMMAEVLTGDGLGPRVRVNSLTLNAHEPLRVLLNLWLTPVKAERGKPLRGQLVLRDTYNQDHDIDPIDWPWIGGQIR